MTSVPLTTRRSLMPAFASGLAAISLCASLALAQCQRAKLTASDGATADLFGFAVAACTETVVIGAPFVDDYGSNSGAAYIFGRFAGAWSEEIKITLNDGATGDGFGRAVGFSDSTALSTSVARDTAFAFQCDEFGNWAWVGQLTPDDGTDEDFFGWSVAIDANVAIVGARHDDDNGWRSGSAYVFDRDPNGVWLQADKLLANDGEPYDRFGTAVAISGDVSVIGAPEDGDLGNYAGSAYIFERDPNGIWSQTAKLLPHDGGPFWSFGESVAVSGNRVLIGATTAHTFAPSGGAAYIFERDPNGAWPQVAQLVSDDIANSDAFGASVALCGDVAVIGAWGDDDHGQQTGAAYVFVRQPEGSWSQVAKLLADDGAAYDQFGNAVAVSGNTAVIGAYYDDDHGEDSGSAYIFAVGPDEDGDGIMDVCLCPGDLDHDLDVDLSDLAQLLSNYGTTSGAVYEDGDLDEDGDVDLSDLAALLAVYGMICP